MIDIKAHSQFDSYKDSVKWRMTPQGLEVEGRIDRTRGYPATVKKIWEKYRDPIVKAASDYGVPVELIIATIATESGGRANAVREEPGFISDSKTPHRVSTGLMQTLISTASSALGRKVTRADLMNPSLSIKAGTAYIAQQKSRTGFTPPKVAAAYNAGSVYYQNGRTNRWKMRQYPIGTGKHVDRFVQWFNDAFALFALEGGPAAAPSFYAAFNGYKPVDREVVKEKMKDNSRVVKNASESSFWSKLQAWFTGIFGTGAVAGSVVDRVTTTTDTTKNVASRFGMDEGLILGLVLVAVAAISIIIYVKQRKVIDARVEDEISGKTDSTEY